MMQAGLLSAENDAESAERSRIFASRLAVHAMVLAEMRQNSAAEWRYARSATIATHRGPAEFASSSLGLLSHFYSLQGSTARLSKWRRQLCLTVMMRCLCIFVHHCA